MLKPSYIVLSLYKFFEIKKIFGFRNKLKGIFNNVNVKGIILVAPEGVNINISIIESEYTMTMKELKKIIKFNRKDIKETKEKNHIYKKFKIKIKKEILTTRKMKVTNPLTRVGKYVEAENWNSLISSSDTILIDMRNNFEIKMGTFKNSINPYCNNFTDLLNWIENDLIFMKNIQKKKIAMFCTGGIRCEKASSFLIRLGKKNVYHLRGGIIKYLERQNKTDNFWTGECFVFDNRVSLNNKLKKGSYSLCYACRMPLSEKDKKHTFYVKGESCHMCFENKTEKQRDKYRMRMTNLRSKI